MSIQTSFTTPAARACLETPQTTTDEPSPWPSELPHALVAPLTPRRSWKRPTACLEQAVPTLSARARVLLIRRLSPREQRKLVNYRPTEQQLLRIAMRCSRADLLAQRGVGQRIVDEIETWLIAHGKVLREGPASLQAALAQAVNHIEAMLDGADESAFLAAYLALPELRRSLRQDLCGETTSQP